MAESRATAAIAVETRAKFFRGLADPARLALLLGLLDGPRRAGELAHIAGLSASNASNHLRCLLECGLVEVAAEGRHNVYRLAAPEIADVLSASTSLLHDRVGRLIEACENYGAPSRRRLRPSKRPTERLLPLRLDTRPV